MQMERLLTFGSYRLNPQTGQLWRGTHEVKVTPKALAVLRLLVGRPGEVVTKDEFFQAVWPDTVVSDDALTACIQELRRAFRETARRPHYIETVHRRGFRFLPTITTPPVVSDQFSVISPDKAKIRNPRLGTGNWQLTTPLVGRENELAQLHGWLEKASRGERQLVFVSGEAGIGKTTVVEAFLQTLDSRRQTLDACVWIGRGQCVEHFGAGEAYLPVLEALGRLCREAAGQDVIALLRQQAPTWLVQMPTLVSPAELEELQRRTAGVTRERMLRELTEALEALTAERTLILRLEDLHWSDYSTLDLLSVLARRQEAAQLLILGTYRPVEILTRDHPLKGVKHELQLHGQCEELALDFLSEAAVAEYLAVRFPVGATHASPLRSLAHVIHQRTDGNPLFMVNVVNDLVAQSVVVQTNGGWELRGEVSERTLRMPVSLWQLIEQQIERVRPEEREVLEVASIVGAEFSAAAVAAGVEQPPETVEARCEALARREQFLRARGVSEWRDGTVATRYQFLHALYQEVLYERIPAARRSRLHRQIGERIEAAYGTQAQEVAAELAVHFERGRDYQRAVQYLRQAGENASQRNAYVEAINLLSKGLELLKTLPDTPEYIQQELALQVALGAPLIATKGQGAPEVGHVYARARELCQLTGETSRLFPILRGLWEFYELRTEYQIAQELGEQLLALAQRQPDPSLLLLAHNVLGDTLLMQGEFSVAHEHLERGEALYDVHQHRSHAFLYGYDSGVHCLSFAAWALWLLGYPDQALKKIYAALSLARDVSHPFTFVFALLHSSILHHLRREAQATQECAETEIALCIEQGFALFLAGGSMYRGWALVEQGQGKEGIAQIHEALAAWQATGTEMDRPHFLGLLAEAYGKVGEAEQGLAALVDALAQVEKTGERWYEAELYRLKGQLTLQKFQVSGSKFQVQENQKAKGKSQK
jgi:DNA-binding winged helix-turn-helix (wHTH) protein/predicted ATPase